VRTVQPVVTLFVQELVGDRPDLATLSGIAFSITGLANVALPPHSSAISVSASGCSSAVSEPQPIRRGVQPGVQRKCTGLAAASGHTR
jgi:hypothetical protein